MSLTPKQEKFAECVASGMTYADSYREAYNAENSTNETIWSKASELMANGKVEARVDEIKQECVKDIKYGVEECFAEFESLQLDAMGDKDRAIAKSCIENKGKLKGLYVEQRVVTGAIAIADPSDEAFNEIMEKTKL